MRCCFDAANFLQNPQNRHHGAHPSGRDMFFFCRFEHWFISCFSRCCTAWICYIGSRYNGTWLYITCGVLKLEQNGQHFTDFIFEGNLFKKSCHILIETFFEDCVCVWRFYHNLMLTDCGLTTTAGLCRQYFQMHYPGRKSILFHVFWRMF